LIPEPKWDSNVQKPVAKSDEGAVNWRFREHFDVCECKTLNKILCSHIELLESVADEVAVGSSEAVIRLRRLWAFRDTAVSG
jgi:hypothetical protein